MQPTEIPFTIGDVVWVNHNIIGTDKPYCEGKVTRIEIGDFSFYKTDKMVYADKEKQVVCFRKILYHVSLFPVLKRRQTYEYCLDDENSYLFPTEHELLAYRSENPGKQKNVCKDSGLFY